MGYQRLWEPSVERFQLLELSYRNLFCADRLQTPPLLSGNANVMSLG